MTAGTAGPEPRVVAHIAAAPEHDATKRGALLPELSARAETGGILLSTCHRVEWIAEPDDIAPDEGTAGLSASTATVLHGQAAARHIIRLALGLESSVLGEDQVLHQLRSAVSATRARRPIGGDLARLIDVALRAGRIGRSWRPRLESSLADRAFTIAHERIPAPGRLLVVGTGEMGRLAAEGGRRRGWSVTIVGRAAAPGADDPDASDPLSPFDPGPAIVAPSDVVIVALAGDWRISPATAAALARVSIVIDLSDPPAIEATLRAGLGDRCIDIDELARRRPTGADVERYRARLGRLAEETLEAYLEDVRIRRESLAERLAQRVERHRTEAIEAYLRDRPDLDPALRDELDAVTRGLSARLFREPLARLARDPDGRRGAALEDLFGW